MAKKKIKIMPIIRFINTTSGETAQSALWNFGDGTTLSTLDATVVHTYDQTGSYTARLDSTSITNQTGYRIQTVTVTPIPNYYPTAMFHWVGKPVILAGPYTLPLIDDSTDSTSWDYTSSWGEQSSLQNPTFNPPSTLWDGSHNPVWVRQTVWNQYGSDTTRIDGTRGASPTTGGGPTTAPA